MEKQRDEWERLSVPYEPIPGIGSAEGIYALYQGSVLKYIGVSEVVGHRVEKWRSDARRYFKNPECHDWDRARVQPVGSGGSTRWEWEDYWLYHLHPPCNEKIPPTEPPRPPELDDLLTGGRGQ